MRSLTTVTVALALMAFSARAHAQVIGTFSWQTQPFCNVVTLTVIQHGGLFQLHGTDDLCGTGSAPVTGTAVPVGGGAAFGLTVALPNGSVAHISATINLATFSGMWSDDTGKSGTFLFGGNTGGEARPVPTRFTGAITGGNGEGVGSTICTAVGVEVFIRNASGILLDARFSFIVPGFAHGQIRSDGSIRSASPELASVEHPSPGAYCLVFSAVPSPPQREATVVSIHAER